MAVQDDFDPNSGRLARYIGDAYSGYKQRQNAKADFATGYKAATHPNNPFFQSPKTEKARSAVTGAIDSARALSGSVARATGVPALNLSRPSAPAAAPAAPPDITNIPPAESAPATTQGSAVTPTATTTAAATPNAGADRVLGTFNGREITQSMSDELQGKLPISNAPPVAGPNGGFALSRGAAPALGAAPTADAGAAPVLARSGRAAGARGVGFRGTGGGPAYGTDANSQIDSALFRIGIQGANTPGKRRMVEGLLSAKAGLERGTADRQLAAEQGRMAADNQIALANAGAANQLAQGRLQRQTALETAGLNSDSRIAEQILSTQGRLAEQELANKGALDVANARAPAIDPRGQIAALKSLTAAREQLALTGGDVGAFDNSPQGQMLAQLQSGLAGVQAPQPAPTLQEFMASLKAKGSKMSDADLTAYYNENYGKQ